MAQNMTRYFIMIFVSIAILTTSAVAQNQYFFGLDIGPKVDIYRLATGGSRPYSPSFRVKNDMGALFGVSAGAIVEEKIMLETGLYRSNFRAVIEIVNEENQTYFRNTPVNTFTAWFLPFNFNFRKPMKNQKGGYLFGGFGASTLVGIKKGINEPYFSHGELVDPSDVNQGTIAYQINANAFDAKIVTINANGGVQYAINDQVFASAQLSLRMGVSGNNYVDFEHETPEQASVLNSIYTSGSGFQMQLGFRYLLGRDE